MQSAHRWARPVSACRNEGGPGFSCIVLLDVCSVWQLHGTLGYTGCALCVVFLQLVGDIQCTASEREAAKASCHCMSSNNLLFHWRIAGLLARDALVLFVLHGASRIPLPCQDSVGYSRIQFWPLDPCRSWFGSFRGSVADPRRQIARRVPTSIDEDLFKMTSNPQTSVSAALGAQHLASFNLVMCCWPFGYPTLSFSFAMQKGTSRKHFGCGVASGYGSRRREAGGLTLSLALSGVEARLCSKARAM